MAYLNIDTSKERFGSRTTIAHLAATAFDSEDSNELHIYRADQILRRDWPWEVEAIEMEYALSVQATFKDGSKLNISAWADCCRQGDSNYGNCRWCGGRYL